MQVLSLHEAHDNGWQIGELLEFVTPRYEEVWDDLDPQETLRRIARSQDERSYYATRGYLRGRLLEHKPQRAFNPALDTILDNTINRFYFGDDVPIANSNAQAKQQRERETQRSQRTETAIAEISLELAGIDFKGLPNFLSTVIIPKYGDGFKGEEFNRVLYRAVRIFATQNTDFMESFDAAMPADNAPAAIAKHFATYPHLQMIEDLLVELLRPSNPEHKADPHAKPQRITLKEPKLLYATKSGTKVHQIVADPLYGHVLCISNPSGALEVSFKGDFLPEDTERIAQFTNGSANIPFLRNKLLEALA